MPRSPETRRRVPARPFADAWQSLGVPEGDAGIDLRLSIELDWVCECGVDQVASWPLIFHAWTDRRSIRYATKHGIPGVCGICGRAIKTDAPVFVIGDRPRQIWRWVPAGEVTSQLVV